MIIHGRLLSVWLIYSCICIDTLGGGLAGGIKITALSARLGKVSDGACFVPFYGNGKSRSLFPKTGFPIRFLIYTFDVLVVNCRPVF